MPSAVPYTPRGFVPDRYEPNSGRLVDLARQRGRDQGDAIRRGGEISANLWSGIGQNVAGTLREIASLPEQARQRQMQDLRLQREEAAFTSQQQQAQQDQAKAAKLKELTTQFQGQRVPTDVLIQHFGPEDAAGIDKAFDELFPPAAKVGTREIKVRNTDGSESIQLVEDKPGATFTSAAPVEKPEPLPSLQRETLLVNGKPTIVNFNPKTGQYADLQGQPVQVAPIPPKDPSSGPRGLTPNMESQVIGRLAKQWTEASKPARELGRQVKLMEVGLDNAKKGNMAQGGQAVLVTFQKILDPPSVVRESEYNRSAAGQSLKNRVQGAYERLIKGGPGVTYDELAKFAQLAREAAQAQQGGYLDSVKHRLGKTADRYNIPHELIYELDAPDEADTPAKPTYLSNDPNFGTPVAPVKPKGKG